MTTRELPPSQLSGVNVLTEGPTGTGKTHALGTLVDTGVETFVLFTESGLESLLGYWTDRGKEVPPNLHWHVLERAPGSFATLAESAQHINTYTQESLHKMQDPNRSKHNQFIGLLKALADFPDDRTKQRFGAVDTWGPDRALVIDSLTGINPIALSLVVGGKPVKSQADWGIAQDQIEKLLRQLTDGCKCHFILTAHVEREIDQVFGGVKITVATLGRALAPKIPPMFSDVVLTYREGAKFLWSTANAQADLKTRNLAIADGLPQDFATIINKWKSRGGAFVSTFTPNAGATPAK
ncbi:MAG: AAA family ATPase [Gemmatimonadales bacterium]|nr:AAA family ATPase [Gemmatimonadales bacterium]